MMPISTVTQGIGPESTHVKRFFKAHAPTPKPDVDVRRPNDTAKAVPLEEVLFNTLASFKIAISYVSMHLPSGGRQKLFNQLDDLLSYDSWEASDAPVSIESFQTFLRTYLTLKPAQFGEIGATSDGRLVAAWFRGKNRLTIVFGLRDRVSFMMTVTDGSDVERLAGETTIKRLTETLRPYDPERWFVGQWDALWQKLR